MPVVRFRPCDLVEVLSTLSVIKKLWVYSIGFDSILHSISTSSIVAVMDEGRFVLTLLM